MGDFEFIPTLSRRGGKGKAGLLLYHRRVWTSELEKLEVQRESLEKIILDKCQAYSRFYGSESPEDRHLADEMIEFKNSSLGQRQSLREGLMETLQYPVQYVVLTKSVLMDGLLALKKMEANLEADGLLELVTDFTDKEEAINPWVRGEDGQPVPFYEVNCADEEVAMERFNEYERVQKDYRNGILQLRHEFSQNLYDNGGWSENDHFKFEKIRMEYRSVKSSEMLYNRLELELRPISIKELKVHYARSQGNLTYRTKMNALSKQHYAAVSNFIKASLALFREANQKKREKFEQELSLMHDLERKEVIYKQIAVWKQSRIERLKFIDEMRRREDEENKIAMEMMALKQRKRAELDKKRIDEFHRRNEELKARWEKMSTLMEQEAMKDKQKQDEYNLERIKHREHLLDEKEKQRRLQREEEERLRQEVERRLEALRAQVAITVEGDWNRVLQPTEAYTSSKNTVKLVGFRKPDIHVLLKENVPGLGDKGGFDSTFHIHQVQSINNFAVVWLHSTGEIVLASLGQARNYLIPFKLAYYVPRSKRLPILPEGWKPKENLSGKKNIVVLPVGFDASLLSPTSPTLMSAIASKTSTKKKAIEIDGVALSAIKELTFFRPLIDPKSQRTFGSVSAEDISAMLRDSHGLVVERSAISIDAPNGKIKEIGKHVITINVGNTHAALDVIVSPEN
ncbi:hypothetical protein HDU76_001616 [Blyttiomyces sp. JEL0837]|nr:hypothetical protein HDU76_001616 [Blyttiomyces sp. JEL0837]